MRIGVVGVNSVDRDAEAVRAVRKFLFVREDVTVGVVAPQKVRSDYLFLTTDQGTSGPVLVSRISTNVAVSSHVTARKLHEVKQYVLPLSSGPIIAFVVGSQISAAGHDGDDDPWSVNVRSSQKETLSNTTDLAVPYRQRECTPTPDETILFMRSFMRFDPKPQPSYEPTQEGKILIGSMTQKIEIDGRYHQGPAHAQL